MSLVNIQTWDDWFNNCGSVSPLCEKYEHTMSKYYELQMTKKPQMQLLRAQAFEDRHATGFFKYDSMIPKWKWIFSAETAGGIFGFGFIILFVLSLFNIVPFYDGNLENLVILDKLKLSALHALPLLLIVFVILIGIHFLRVVMIRNNMTKQENLMRERIRFVPPKYRNSACTKYLFELYKMYGTPYDVAIQNCDEYMQSNGLIGAYMSIMFDEPMSDLNLQVQTGLVDMVDDMSDLDISFNGGSSINSYDNSKADMSGTNIAPLEDSWNPVQDLEIHDANLPDDIKQKVHVGISDADNYLNSMIGLESVKSTVRKMKNRMSFYADEGGAKRISGSNMVFLGSPGTGKSTVARVLCSILSDFGYIKNNYCLEIDGNYLKSPYPGRTAEITNSIINFCEEIGALLFIDECYTLLDENGTGKEALTTILQAMEQKKDSLVVIFAGYEDDVNRLIASNTGFSSRIKYKLYFEDYTEDELIEIFKQMMSSYAKGTKYEITETALQKLKSQYGAEKRSPSFGNARVVRNSLDKILDIHADRFMRGDITPDHKFVIEEADVDDYIKDRKVQLEEDKRNFLANNDLDSKIITMQDLKSHMKDGSSTPEADLNSLIGLETVKEEMQQLKAQHEFYDGKMDSFGHCLFIGPAGTGKTTVAKILTGYFYELGLISENRFFDCTGAYLQGSFLGHTSKRTQAILEYSRNGVLFIDEAYSLLGPDGKNTEYGAEAVAVLIDFMEKNRNDLIIIFAGYEKEMNDFLNANSGIKSRISQTFHFESYSPNQLAHIMNSYVRADKFKVEKECWRPIQFYFKDHLNDANFGNARSARNLWAKVKKQHIYNYGQGQIDKSKKYVITLKDVQDVLQK